MVQQTNDDYQSLNSPLLSVIRELHLKRYLRFAGFVKTRGASSLSMAVDMINSIFLGDNLWRASTSSGKDLLNSSDKALYRFMSNIHFNWYALCFYVGACGMRNIRNFSQSNSKDDLCIIIDDTNIETPSTKCGENCTWNFDHNGNKYVKGYVGLGISVTDGSTTLSLGHKVVVSNEDTIIKNGSCRKKACPTPRIPKKKCDGRSHKAFLKKESHVSKPDLVVKMVKQAVKYIGGIHYVLMDSWFNYEPLFKQIKELGQHVIGMLKQDHRKYHRLNRKGQSKGCLTVANLAKTVRHRKFKDPHIFGCEVVVAQTQKESFEEGVKLKLVYLRNWSNDEKTVVIASTDLSLSAERIVELYARRWNIEVGFHIQKSFLGLSSECQSTDFASQVAYANLACLRNTLIAYKKRIEEDPRSAGVLFQNLTYDMTEIPLADAIRKIFDMIGSLADELLKAGCIDKSNYQNTKDVIFKVCWKWFKQLDDYIQSFMEQCQSEIVNLLFKVKKHQIGLKQACLAIS